MSLPWMTVGLVSADGIVTEAPRIAKWARGRQLAAVLAYYRRKGANIREIL